MRIRARFNLFFPLLCFILGFWNGKYTRNCAGTLQSSQSKLINQIYEEAVARSHQAFSKNGGIIDATMISLGQGPKIRIWDYFGPSFNCISKERVGKIGDGGKWLCGVRTVLAHKPSCIVYSIGSKGEVSFEVGIEDKLPNCEIHIFDPTLTFDQKRIMDNLLRKFDFHEVGLGGSNGEMRIKKRRTLWTQKTKSVYPVQSLGSLMADFGHAWIDVLKIDIEGGEWNVFAKLCEEAKPIPATQIQVELHFMGDAKAVLNFFHCMEGKGFRVFSVEPNYYGRTAENAKLMVEYSFIQVDPSGKIVWENSNEE